VTNSNALNIEDADADRLARALAQRTGTSHLSRANRRPVINQSDCTSIPKGVLAQRHISRSSAVTSREALRSANAR
jgi:hypothetical protein